MNILFFDGVCGLCNFWVDFVMKRDHKRLFLFSPLQSDYAAQTLPIGFREDLSTLVLRVDGQILTRSDAILKIFILLGGHWGFIGAVGRLFPKFVRDGIYKFIARNRYAWFGQKATCRLPTPEERERFKL